MNHEIITRRTAIAALGAASQLRAANDQINLAFIGVGIRGTQLLEEFKTLPGLRVAGAADVYDGHHIAAREQTREDLFVTREYERILDRKDVDAVVIATPDHLHAKMTLDALSAGKHVYLEKPMTWSIEQGLQVRDAARKSGKKVSIGSTVKASAIVKAAREVVKSGRLGKVNMIRMSNHRNSPEGAWVYPVPPDASPTTVDWKRFLGPAPQRAFDANVFFRWRCWWEYSGGVATDLFVHLLTQLHEVMGVTAPRSVVSQGGIYRWKDGRTVPDVMNSIYQYDEGFVADMYVNLGNGRFAAPTSVMGSEGTLVFEGQNRLMVYPENAPGPVQRYGSMGWPAAMREEYLAKGRNGAASSPAKPEEIRVEPGPSAYEMFLDAVRNGGPVPQTVDEGFAAAGAAHLANIAYKAGRRAGWDVATGKVTLA